MSDSFHFNPELIETMRRNPNFGKALPRLKCSRVKPSGKIDLRKARVEVGRRECPPSDEADIPPASGPDVEDKAEGQRLKAEIPAARPLANPVLPHGMETAHTLGQRAFEASGAAASQDAKLAEFFFEPDGKIKPHNFGKWFKATFLEEITGATRMNNRAITFRRERLHPMGLDFDNFMVSPGHGQPAASHYRICEIRDSLRLTAEEKEKLLNHQ